jgi:hypothetical protein
MYGMATSTVSRSVRARRFTLHYLEMVVAMTVGMIALGPVWRWGLVAAGQRAVYERPSVHVLLMAFDMTVAMWLWMRFRGHSVAATAEMAAAMVVPFLLVLPPFWAGAVGEDGLYTVGHGLMLLAMLGVMLRRPDGYTSHHSGHHPVTSA